MDKECPFWKEESECSAGGECGIRSCDDEVPDGLKHGPGTANQNQVVDKPCTEEDKNNNALDPLDSTMSQAERDAFLRWAEHDESSSKYCEAEDENPADLHFVDLLRNPERYTGYAGNSAARVWRSIYEENCFKPDPKYDKNFLLNPKVTGTNLKGLCLEKRVFFRLMSGLHTSITVQIAAHHYKPPVGGFGTGTWSRNLDMFKWRFSEETTNGEGPERLKNLYFTYCLLLRAVQKASPYLLNEQFYTGNSVHDKETKKLVNELLTAVDEFKDHFDETVMFQGIPARAASLKEEFRQHFFNVSRIMDCVACDKCRLWGKLNTHGMAVALKILFSRPSTISPDTLHMPAAVFQLTRNDIVALLNSLGRYASSVHELGSFKDLLRAETKHSEL